MRWCDKNQVGYVFGFQKNSILNRQIACEMTQARIKHSCYGNKQSCFKWFRYRASSWDRHRWMIGKAEYGGKGPNPRFVVTNLPSDEGIADTTYHRPCIDGKQVHCVKELGTVCSVAHNPREFYESMYCIRLRLFKIAARVRVTCRRVVFHLASHSPSAAVFDAVLVRLCRSD